MLRFRLLCLMFPLLLFSGLFAWAAPEQAPPQSAPEQVITPSRTYLPIGMSAESVTVITAQEISDSGIRSLGDILRLVPGVFVDQGGEFGFPAFARIRGTNINHVLVLVNGERVSIQGFGLGTDLARFTVEDITRIEIVRGALSNLYGSDAIGGVVNIITDQTSTNSSGKAEFGIGTAGQQSRSIIANGGGKVGFRVGAVSPVFDGRREGADFSATRYFADLMPSLGDWKVIVRAHHYQDTTGLARWVALRQATGGPGFLGYDDNDQQTTERTRYSVSVGHAVGAGGLGIQAYHLEQEYHPTLTVGEFGPVTDYRLTANTDAQDFNYTYSTGRHNFLLGGEVRKEKFRVSDVVTPELIQTTEIEVQGVESKTITTKGFYIDDHWGLDANTLVVAGVRFDDHSVAGNVTSPRISLIRGLPAGLKLRATYAEGFRAPSFVELYSDINGNPDLDTEKSRQYELALTTTRGKNTLEAVAFNYDTDNLIVLVPGYPAVYENVARARQRGVEVSWQRQVTPELSLISSYTFVDATDRSNDHRLAGIPRDLASATARYATGKWKVMLTGWWYAGIPESKTEVTFPDRVIFNLSAVWAAHELIQPYLTIRNLTNSAVLQRDMDFEPLGTSVEFGLRTAW